MNSPRTFLDGCRGQRIIRLYITCTCSLFELAVSLSIPPSSPPDKVFSFSFCCRNCCCILRFQPTCLMQQPPTHKVSSRIVQDTVTSCLSVYESGVMAACLCDTNTLVSALFSTPSVTELRSSEKRLSSLRGGAAASRTASSCSAVRAVEERSSL